MTEINVYFDDETLIRALGYESKFIWLELENFHSLKKKGVNFY